ncbi:MAG: SDR family oxidoreductase [Gaiellaceae bacterium]
MKGECTFMNNLIARANGTTGKQIIGELSKNPQMTVYGMIRKEEQAQTIKGIGGHPILADLEGNVDKSVDNMEAIIFAAGSGPKTGPDKTTAVDKNGAIQLVDAIERFVMLSSVGSDDPEQAQEGMRHYLEAKHDADEHLKASGLTYTIVRPVALTNEQATEKIFADEKVDHANKYIPRADVSAVLAKSVTEEKTFNKTFEIFSGTLPIKEALNNM